MTSDTVRSLGEADAEAFLALRQEALREAPLAFLASPEDDLADSVEAARAILRAETGSMVFGAFADDLAGMAGLYRERALKALHKVNLWGFYVRPAARRRGLGRCLLETALDHARAMEGVTSVRLSVSETAPAAKALYEQAGFQVWGREPEALSHDGRLCAEDHMVLKP